MPFKGARSSCAYVQANGADRSCIAQSAADSVGVLAMESDGAENVAAIVEADHAEPFADDRERDARQGMRNSEFRIASWRPPSGT